MLAIATVKAARKLIVSRSWLSITRKFCKPTLKRNPASVMFIYGICGGIIGLSAEYILGGEELSDSMILGSETGLACFLVGTLNYPSLPLTWPIYGIIVIIVLEYRRRTMQWRKYLPEDC